MTQAFTDLISEERRIDRAQAGIVRVGKVSRVHDLNGRPTLDVVVTSDRGFPYVISNVATAHPIEPGADVVVETPKGDLFHGSFVTGRVVPAAPYYSRATQDLASEFDFLGDTLALFTTSRLAPLTVSQGEVTLLFTLRVPPMTVTYRRAEGDQNTAFVDEQIRPVAFTIELRLLDSQGTELGTETSREVVALTGFSEPIPRGARDGRAFKVSTGAYPHATTVRFTGLEGLLGRRLQPTVVLRFIKSVQYPTVSLKFGNSFTGELAQLGTSAGAA